MSETLGLTRLRIRYAWFFLAPMILILVLVAGWPLMRTIWFSFTDANLADLSDIRFIWFENYLANYEGEWSGILVDPEWWNSVWNTLYFTVISVSMELVLGMIFALVLNANFRGRGWVRAAVLIPWAIPTVVSAKMWGWMYHDQFGMINDLLLKMGLLDRALAWTADSDLALISVIIVDVWKTTSFMTLLLLAALQMLPTDCYESAKLDGIHPVKVFYRVTLPLIAPAMMVAVIFRALDALRIFDLIYILTSNNADTMSMSIYARQQLIAFQNVGIGSAASTVLFLLVALMVIVYLYLGRRQFARD